jgi:hypothetical protein
MSTPEAIVENMETSTEVVPSVSIENLLNMRTSALERYTRALALLQEAEDITAAAHLGRVRIEIRTSAREGCPVVAAEAASVVTQELDKGAWGYLMGESGLRTFMDATARRKWDEQVYKGEVPELSRQNIEATFTTMHRLRGEMFERGVIACFRRLSWDYKTNQPFKFGKRIVLGYLFSIYGHGTSRSMHLRHEATDQLDDLVRVFHVLDNQPEPDHRQGMRYQISDAVHARQSEYESTYLQIRWYLKGSAHVTFKRADLVDQLNTILARHYPHALPAPRA